MSIPAQFQIGLELTNIVNPLSQAISALGSLALVDAIKKSGSDAITEMKLAALIGRHRIDEVIKWHFREQVAKSDRSIISRYVDIVLESGAGPTVQEALKNPALFSMVIQLSALAFGAEDESLANAIVEAIERIVQESGRDIGIVPDYVSLLGTIRACQEQTAAFRWAPLFENVEWKIEKALIGDDTKALADTTHQSSRHTVTHDSSLPSVTIRALSFPILQSLLMWLQSLQNFPEHRLLHIKCDRGISMAVVWCHHLLGLNVSVNIRGAEISFGQGSANIVIEECDFQNVGASLMDPADPHEPLFSLAKDENYPGGSHEFRVEAYGFGMRVLKVALRDAKSIKYCEHWIISNSLTSVIDRETVKTGPQMIVIDENLQRQRLLKAGQFIFANDKLDMALISSLYGRPFNTNVSSAATVCRLMAVLTAFARVEDVDLERIRHLPLSFAEYERIQTLSHGIQRFSVSAKRPTERHGTFSFRTSVLDAFSLISRLLLGHMYSKEYLKAVLISAWGWSIFFDCMDTIDPAQVSIDKMRILEGVPARGDMRRKRIIDGPVGSSRLPLAEYITGQSGARFFPGISTAQIGRVLVGYHSDAFQVTQPLTWKYLGNEQHIYRLAFRKRLDQCVDHTTVLRPCECTKSDEPEGNLAWIDERVNTDGILEVQAPKHGLPERVFESYVKRRTFFYVAAEDSSARWFLLDDLCNACGPDTMYFLRSCNTCVKCAMDLIPDSERHRSIVIL